jgi:serine/threonine-protein kinase
MRDFVIGLYGELPGNARDAWTKLDTGYQNQTGLTDYLDFWSTIESVNVMSVTPRDANSVVVRLTFVPRNGETNTEDRWLSVVLKNGVMLVYDSQRIATVS